jgi:hypothetical protein|tara:strand:- start:19078 stop:20271 length:1194 start_codon:yes stop_codon:yes gene_type:complete
MLELFQFLVRLVVDIGTGLFVPVVFASLFFLIRAFLTISGSSRSRKQILDAKHIFAAAALSAAFGVAMAIITYVAGNVSRDDFVDSVLLVPLIFSPFGVVVVGIHQLVQNYFSDEKFNAEFSDVGSDETHHGQTHARKIGLVVSCSRNVGDYTFVGTSIGPRGIEVEQTEIISSEIAKGIREESKEISIAGMTGSKWNNSKTTKNSGISLCQSCGRSEILLCGRCDHYFCAPDGGFRKPVHCPDCRVDVKALGRQPFRLVGIALDQQQTAGAGNHGNAGAGAGKDDDFGFDENARAWGGSGSSDGNHGADDRKPADDYAEMMRRAADAIKNVSEPQAASRAEWAEKKSNQPGLNEWERQYYQCMAMLLRERAKGFQGRQDNAPPTEEEERVLSLPER